MSRDLVRRVLERSSARHIKETQDGFTSLCPFHHDQHQSFAVSAEGLYLCYSAACGARGNLYSFLTKVGGYAPGEAFKLADVAPLMGSSSGGTVKLDIPPFARRRRQREPTSLERLDEWEILAYARYCPRYMRDRGFERATLRHFQIGFDPETAQVVIPVRGPEGRLAGLLRRATIPGSFPKYKIEVPAGRGSLVYNYDKVVAQHYDNVVVVEGTIDAMWVHQAGIPNVVALLGSTITRGQACLLKRAFDRFILLLDNDEAGTAGTRKVVAKLGSRKVRVASSFLGDIDPAETSPEGIRRCLFKAISATEWSISVAVR